MRVFVAFGGRLQSLCACNGLTVAFDFCFEGAEAREAVGQWEAPGAVEMNRCHAFQGVGRVSSEPQLVSVVLGF